MKGNTGCIGTLLFIAIFFGSGLINTIVFGVLSDGYNEIFAFMYLTIPQLCVFITREFVKLVGKWKKIKKSFKYKEDENILKINIEQLKKAHSRSAIYITVLIFFISGLVSGLLADDYWYHVLFSIVMGIIWGVIWCFCYQTTYFYDHLIKDSKKQLPYMFNRFRS